MDHPIVTSVGIFVYHNPDGSERRELRLPEEVFSPKSLASYKGKPIIVTHEAGYVDKDNVQEEHIGTILSEGYQDGEDVRCEVIIHDTDAVKDTGLRELSCGYNLRLEETPGVWEGQPYAHLPGHWQVHGMPVEDREGHAAALIVLSGVTPPPGLLIYTGELYRELMRKWVEDNVGLIKTIPQESLGRMREIVLEGYMNGETTTSIVKKIQKAYSTDRRHAQLLARDQIAKLNAPRPSGRRRP